MVKTLTQPQIRAAKIAFVLLLALSAVVVLYLAVSGYFRFEYLRDHHAELVNYYNEHPIAAMLIYVGIMVAIAGFWGWGQVPLTILAGAIFGRWLGFGLALAAAAVGDLIACWLSRSFLAPLLHLENRKGMDKLREGIERDGPYYLFMLRLLPVVPAFLVNFGLALTPIKLWTFFWVTLLGTMPGKFLYAHAGRELARLEGWSGVVSPRILVALVALGVFPLAVRLLLRLKKDKGQRPVEGDPRRSESVPFEGHPQMSP